VDEMTDAALETGQQIEIDGRLIARGVVRLVLGVFVVGPMIVLPAGDWGWTWAWVFVIALFGMAGVNIVVLSVVNPAVMIERMQGGKGKVARGWDLAVVTAMSVLALGTFVVASLDHRFGWSGAAPLSRHLLGVALVVSGDLIFLSAMAANRYFAKMVRVQPEHIVADAGPYRFVRHPGYVGWALMVFAPALVLGSYWATLPAFGAIACVVARTALEDRTLQRELAGYAEYAARVRWRLLPGVW
jgi:protein-S-isoprenylcysteine O-methyltransferase Ste14